MIENKQNKNNSQYHKNQKNQTNQKMKCEFIFTCQTDSEQLCLNEMKNRINDIKLLKWLDGGAGMAGSDHCFSEISKIFRESNLIFLRHIFPVEFIFDCDDHYDFKNGFDSVIKKYKEKFDENRTASIQIRSKTGGKIYDLKAIKSHISEKLINYSTANPQIVISVFISDGIIYAGISDVEENLSAWSGGMRHYALNESVISRAEFKLLELFEFFPELINFDKLINLNNPENIKKDKDVVYEIKEKPAALDLGASPGGWTKILAEKGYKVTAVDPNQLSAVLTGNPNVEYFKGLTEDFMNFMKRSKNRGKPELFDLIVNDMRMHAVQSAKIMADAQEYLKEGGYAVMTLKLNKGGKTVLIKEGLDILKKKYDVLFVKQFFHNRSEVTAVLRKTRKN